MLRIGLIGAGNMGSKHARMLQIMHKEGKCKFTACFLIGDPGDLISFDFVKSKPIGLA